ncbi:RodZ domain-containing protein [Aliidiomarina soli]|uniref:Cytoskeleton protein RodZ-like C-terminal domain-containing protein n=1 Tax=Aliidiomarina soli TaxID=1928574 RepID=A0A432WC76_9GAMM|nr:RodZ domain-containing protein [Aliidiomarina soli]RUO29671.1 hypothetical protein CWE14_14550 [Aliidiomarina soli]
MTDQQPHQDVSEDAVQRPAPESPGRLLREGRERLQLTTQQVAERLRLRHQIILDLEGDLFSKYVAGTFTRGYLRSYARLVDVDEEKVLAAYASQGIEEPVDQTMQSFSQRAREQSNDNRLMLVTYIIGAVIIGSAVIFWLQNKDSEVEPVAQGMAERMVSEQDASVELEPASSEVETTSATRDPIFIDASVVADRANRETDVASGNTPRSTDVVENDQANRDVAEGSSQNNAESATSEPANSAQSEAVDESATTAEPVEPTPARQATPQPTQAEPEEAPLPLPDAELVLRFSDDTWIRIEDNNGDAVAFGVKGSGHITELNDQGPYQVTLGAPENVEMYYQGTLVDLSGYRPGRVVRMTLPADE